MTRTPSIKHEKIWNARYNELVAYKKRVGNCNVPRAHPMGLGKWVDKQRQRYMLGKMSDDRTKLLGDIGFRLQDDRWEQKFNLLIEYKKKTGDCNVTQKTNQTTLFQWVRTQRHMYNAGKLSDDRLKRLEAIGFCWEARFVDHRWEQYFEQLVEHKAEHGHLKVSWKNQNLARWVRQQHDAKSMSRERIARLQALGFEWRGNNAPVCESEDDSDTAAGAGARGNVADEIMKPSADERTSSGGLDGMDRKKRAARGRTQRIMKGTAVNRQTNGEGEIKSKQTTRSTSSGRAARCGTQQTNQRRSKRLKQCNIYCDEIQSRHSPKLQCTDEGEAIKEESDTGGGNVALKQCSDASIERRTSRRLLHHTKRGGTPHPEMEVKNAGDASGHAMLNQVVESPAAASQSKVDTKSASENEDRKIEDESPTPTPNPVTTNPNATTIGQQIDYKDLCIRLTTKVFEQKAKIKTLMNETNRQKVEISLLKDELAIERGLHESAQCT